MFGRQLYAARFTLFLFVMTIACLCFACRKNKGVPYPQNYTANMGRVRTWTGTYSWGFGGPGPQNDTQTFAISVVNSSTITVQNVILHYKSYNDTAKSMLFEGPVSVQDSTAVTYYFLADSLVYYSYSRPTLCCYEEYYLTAK